MPDGEDGGAGLADSFDRTDPPILSLTLRPHRSLTCGTGTWLLILITAGLALPLVSLAGTVAAWGVLPFQAAALVALYWALRRNQFDGGLTEELRLWPNLITVVRREPRGAVRRWHANPYWVEPRLRDDTLVENYLTLRGSGREIELGAFLGPEERLALHGELRAALARLRTEGAPEGGWLRSVPS